MKNKEIVTTSIVLVSVALMNIAGVPSAVAKSQNEKVGDILQYAIPLTGLGMAVAKHDNEGMKQLGKTLLVNTATTYGLKYAFNDTSLGERPNGGNILFRLGIPAMRVQVRHLSGNAMAGNMVHWQCYPQAMWAGHGSMPINTMSVMWSQAVR